MIELLIYVALGGLYLLVGLRLCRFPFRHVSAMLKETRAGQQLTERESLLGGALLTLTPIFLFAWPIFPILLLVGTVLMSALVMVQKAVSR